MAKKPARAHGFRDNVTRPPRRSMLRVLGLDEVDYKDTSALRMFISEHGKIRSRRVTGLTTQQQRQVAGAIKNAREMALLPYPKQRRVQSSPKNQGSQKN